MVVAELWEDGLDLASTAHLSWGQGLESLDGLATVCILMDQPIGGNHRGVGGILSFLHGQCTLPLYRCTPKNRSRVQQGVLERLERHMGKLERRFRLHLSPWLCLSFFTCRLTHSAFYSTHLCKLSRHVCLYVSHLLFSMLSMSFSKESSAWGRSSSA